MVDAIVTGVRCVGSAAEEVMAIGAKKARVFDKERGVRPLDWRRGKGVQEMSVTDGMSLWFLYFSGRSPASGWLFF